MVVVSIVTGIVVLVCLGSWLLWHRKNVALQSNLRKRAREHDALIIDTEKGDAVAMAKLSADTYESGRLMQLMETIRPGWREDRRRAIEQGNLTIRRIEFLDQARTAFKATQNAASHEERIDALTYYLRVLLNNTAIGSFELAKGLSAEQALKELNGSINRYWNELLRRIELDDSDAFNEAEQLYLDTVDAQIVHTSDAYERRFSNLRINGKTVTMLERPPEWNAWVSTYIEHPAYSQFLPLPQEPHAFGRLAARVVEEGTDWLTALIILKARSENADALAQIPDNLATSLRLIVAKAQTNA